jgi:hypothetical protein
VYFGQRFCQAARTTPDIDEVIRRFQSVENERLAQETSKGIELAADCEAYGFIVAV